MFANSILKDALSKSITDTDKALLCLAVDPMAPRAIKDIVSIGYSAGWRAVKKKNISLLLSRSKGNVVRGDDGWELTSAGKLHVSKLIQPLSSSPIPAVASSLRSHLSKITNDDTKLFVGEAVACFEAQQFRAAVVLSWVGAVALLQTYVVNNKLGEFNAEAKARNPKWKYALTTDDIGLMTEDSFLDVLQAISILGKNVKQELKKALILRNGCGHPNSLKLAEHKVSAHIEDLVLNVFAVF